MMRNGRFCLMSLVAGMATIWVSSASAETPPPPWERTEVRSDCTEYSATRSPFFGDTHVHTNYSFDAVTGDIRTGPREAYDFAKGGVIDLPPYDAMNVAQRSAQLRRPLDFTALSDHAELFGEVQICLVPGLDDGYNSTECQDYRAGIPQMNGGTGSVAVLAAPYLSLLNPQRFPWCGVGGIDCLNEASLVWQDIRDAADEHYDRTAACTFTSFVAYEWTGAPLARNFHRNVIFRNEFVPGLPTSYVDEPKAEDLHLALQSGCIDGIAGCDVLAIPHNSNLSNGEQFIPENADGSPFEPADAAFRARMEPVVEIYQHKGDSECRDGILANDEQCGFEKMTTVLLGVPAPGPYDPRLFVRNILKEGLQIEDTIGVNPYPMGIIGSTDSHGSTPGLVHEEDYGTAGHLGTRDGTPELVTEDPISAPLGGIEASAGGLAVVWAEENSRDAIFAAMRRREVYGTSGTRPILRFFAGKYKDTICEGDFAATGYASGVPMGGEIGALNKAKSPVFAVQAQSDPGGTGLVTVPLQVVQIVKGWVDSMGQMQEKVFDIDGDANNGATVDETTCVPSSTTANSFCTVWEDPEFDASQRAFYYVRALENPTCRWSTYVCNNAGVVCPGTVPAGMEECCDPDLAKTVQERAWSSPIFYRPDSFGKFKGSFKLKGGGEDAFKMNASFEDFPADLIPDDPMGDDIVVTVSDDDEIFTATIPAGTLEEKKPGLLYQLTDKEGTIVAGVKKIKIKINSKGQGKLSLQTIKTDLSAADPVSHFVTTRIRAGDYSAEHSRTWTAKGTSLKASN